MKPNVIHVPIKNELSVFFHLLCARQSGKMTTRWTLHSNKGGGGSTCVNYCPTLHCPCSVSHIYSARCHLSYQSHPNRIFLGAFVGLLGERGGCGLSGLAAALLQRLLPATAAGRRWRLRTRRAEWDSAATTVSCLCRTKQRHHRGTLGSLQRGIIRYITPTASHCALLQYRNHAIPYLYPRRNLRALCRCRMRSQSSARTGTCRTRCPCRSLKGIR